MSESAHNKANKGLIKICWWWWWYSSSSQQCGNKWNDLSLSLATLETSNVFIIFNFPTLGLIHTSLTLWLESCLCGKFTAILCEAQEKAERNLRTWNMKICFFILTHTQKLRYTKGDDTRFRERKLNLFSVHWDTIGSFKGSKEKFVFDSVWILL